MVLCLKVTHISLSYVWKWHRFCFLTILLKNCSDTDRWMLLKHVRVGRAAKHQSNTDMDNIPVRQKWTQNWLVQRIKGMPSYAKQNISAQLHIRLDPLKLPRDPLKVVAESKHGAQRPQKPYVFFRGGGGERLYIPIATLSLPEWVMHQGGQRWEPF